MISLLRVRLHPVRDALTAEICKLNLQIVLFLSSVSLYLFCIPDFLAELPPPGKLHARGFRISFAQKRLLTAISVLLPNLER